MRKLTKFKATSFNGSVDFDNRVIREVVLIEPNREATGHGMYVDQTMVNQVVEQGQAGAEIGFKARFDHPNACTTSMGTQLGRLRNFKLKGNKAVADLHIAEFTKHSPNGDMGKWLLNVANEDPDQVGFSIVFSQAESVSFEPSDGDDADDAKFRYPHARIDQFYGADVVDEGAATSSLFEDGIMGRPNYLAEQAQMWCEEHSELLAQVLEPTIENIINQKSINMSDNKKSLKDGLKDLLASFSSEENVDTPEIKTPEVNEEVEAANAELASKSEEIEALKAEIESNKAEFESEKVKTDEVLFAAKEAIEGFKSEIEELKKVSLGTVAEPVATDEEGASVSETDKEQVKELSRAEQIAEWARLQASGKPASAAYIN